MITITPIDDNPQDGSGVTGTRGDPVYGGLPRTYVGGCIQLVGFVPTDEPCEPNAYECRTFYECCDQLLVFGQIVAGGAPFTPDFYKQDVNSFLYYFPGYYTYGPTSCVFWLYKKNPATGNFVYQTQLNNNDYGTYYPFGVKPGVVSNTVTNACTGFAINWSLVLTTFGEGEYQFNVHGISEQGAFCKNSKPFCVRIFNCELAHRTMKLETKIGYNIGSATNPTMLLDLCGFNWYDSIRLKGFFGYPKGKFTKTSTELFTGEIVDTRVERIRTWQMITGWLPRWMHERIEVYGLMADETYASDYNKNNSDWNIKRRRVRVSSDYPPKYTIGSRKSKVTVDFEDAIQNTVKNKCCDTKV